MPEKKYPPRFDFKKLEPDVPVEFTLLRKPFGDKATKDGEEYEWHLWPVKHTDVEMSLFTPNERVHAGLLSLKVKLGDKFTLTKKASVNTETGKPFIFYEISCNDDIITTKDTPPPPETKPEETEDDLTDTPYIKEPSGDSVIQTFNRYYGNIMTLKVDHIASHIDWEKLSDTEKLQTLWELDKSTSANISTILIQNGGRR